MRFVLPAAHAVEPRWLLWRRRRSKHFEICDKKPKGKAMY